MPTTQVTLAICGLIHESNASADEPTTLDDFMRFDAETLDAVAPGSGTEVGGAMLEARALGATTEPTTFAMALSSGRVEESAASALVDELVEGVGAVGGEGPDAVVACLHGSMCSTVDPDLEGTALARIRDAVGHSVPLVATLDWHASITETMVRSTDAIIAYRTYPHVDQEERGREAARLAIDLATGAVSASASWIPVPMMIAGPATRHDHPAMASVLAGARRFAQRDPRILTWSVLPGFARSDNASSGSHVYVAATDAASGTEMAEDIAQALWEARGSFESALLGVDEAVQEAIAAATEGQGPVVLSDQGDNPGGGAPGDSTVLLGALVRHGADGALVASLLSPRTVSGCHDAGVGATVQLDVPPLDSSLSSESVTVESLTDGKYVIHSPTHPNVPFDIGPAALVRTRAGVRAIVTSVPVQNEDLQLFELFGVDPRSVPILAVKSNVHFRAAFEPIASVVIDVDTPGISTPHLSRLPYSSVQRPIWPLDRDFEWTPL